MPNKSTPESFWARVNTGRGKTCWEWQGSKTGWGHGQMKYNEKMEGSHRISHILFIGPIPQGLSVLHSCDNPLCVNPRHLRAGTQGDNLRDAYSRNRKKPPRIRNFEIDSKEMSIAQIARTFDVCPLALRYQLVKRKRSVEQAIKQIRGES